MTMKHKARQRPAGADAGIPLTARRSLCPLGCNPKNPRTGTPYVGEQQMGQEVPKGWYGKEVMDWVPAIGHNQMAIQFRCEKCGGSWFEDKPGQELTTRAIRARQAELKDE